MLKMIKIRMFAAVLLAVVIGITTYLYLKKDFVTVVTAKQDIPPYVPITSDMIEQKTVPKELSVLFEGYVSDSSEVKGWVSNSRICRGSPVIKKPEYMYSPKLEKGYLPYDYCIIGVQLEDNTISAKQGDYIDLYMVVPDDGYRLQMPKLKVLDNQYPPNDILLGDGENGYVFRDVILHDIKDSEESFTGKFETSLLVNKKYQDLLIYGKNSNAKMDIVIKG